MPTHYHNRKNNNSTYTQTLHYNLQISKIAGKHLKKGSQVYVEGKLRTRKWQDQSGQERYTTEVLVDSFTGVMQMLGGNGGGKQQGASGQPRPTQQPAQSPAYTEPPIDYDDDLPF